MPNHHRRRALLFDGLSAVLLLAVMTIALLTFRNYGITWDENDHVEYGDALYSYYSGDSGYTRTLDYSYGGGFDLLGAVVRHALPLETYEAMHLLGCLLGLLGLLGVWKLARLLFGAAGGFVALLLLTLTPVYYGHMFNNPKDLPFAVGYLWTLYFTCAAFQRYPRDRWLVWIELGVTIGLTMSVRIGGLLLICYLFALVLAYAAYRAIESRSFEVLFRHLRRLSVRALAATAIAWATMVALWPWAMHAPLSRPLYALRGMTNFTGHKRMMPFGDREISSIAPPWDYLPRYFGLKLPEVVLLLFAIGLILGGWHLIKRARRGEQLDRNLIYLLLAVAVLFPPIYAIIKASPIYDGLRHFLFLVPPICIIAAGALVALARLLRPRPWAVALLCAAVAVVSARQVAIMRHLHPHEYVFFNSLIGGLPGAIDSYETEYYAGSYREALLGLQARLWRTEPDRYLRRDYRLGGCFSRQMATKYVPANFLKTGHPRDFWLGYTRQKCQQKFADAPLIYSVMRMGTNLTVVQDLRKRPAKPTGPWRGAYYLNPDLRGHPLTRSDANLDFTWPDQPMAGIPADDFSVRWDTCLVVTGDTAVTVELSTNDPASLSIDNDVVIATASAGKTNSAINLAPGHHHVVVDYRHRKGPAHIAFMASFDRRDSLPAPTRLRRPGPDLDSPCNPEDYPLPHE